MDRFITKTLSSFNLIKPKLRCIFFILILMDTSYNYKKFSISFAIALTFIFIMGFVTLIYSKDYDDKKSKYYIIAATIVCILLWYSAKIGEITSIYYFIILDDIFRFEEAKTRNSIISIHFFGFLLLIVANIISSPDKSIKGDIITLVSSLLIYSLVLLIYVILHNYKYERDKLKLLNAKLIEYSFKEREYLVSAERSRISQNLHDSLGHTLMALSMNVKYLKVIKGEDASVEQIDLIEKLVQESIITLRSTVYSLKKLDEDINLQQEIKNVISKFAALDIVKINLDCFSEIETIPNNTKVMLLDTIKEGITNSLKHGNASEINISIENENINNIKLVISDNGIGCKSINKSNGLNGISERFAELDGIVEFINNTRGGFTINVVIPGGIGNDKSNDS